MISFPKTSIENLLQEYFSGETVFIKSHQLLGGGSINYAAKIETNQGWYFVKWNKASLYPEMFEKEARGLEILRQTMTLYIPKVIACGKEGDSSFLILEYIEAGKRDPEFWEKFGTGLARLHRHSDKQYGLAEDNYMGSLVQYNKRYDNFTDFWITQRLMPQLQLAIDKGLMNSKHGKQMKLLYKKLPDLIPNQRYPSLVHGDLWNGNYVINAQGKAALIDPAVAYSHREVDLAMSHLFGGFPSDFYIAYHQEYPFSPGLHKRFELFNLYPLLVHVNLFGRSYLASVEDILKRYTN